VRHVPLSNTQQSGAKAPKGAEKMKKLLLIALFLGLFAFAFTACGSDDPVDTEQAPPTPPAPGPETGAPTPPTPVPTGADPGGVFTVIVNLMDANGLPGWGNAVGNAAMRDITMGFSSPVIATRGAEFIVNPTVVENFVGPVINADGSRTWTITIRDGLRWSDGTPLDARCFVFTYLFWGAPTMSYGDHNLGSNTWTGLRDVNGFDDLRFGRSDVLTGVRLIDNFTYTITIDEYREFDGRSNFPYFYELTYASISPVPMHIIAPGLTVEDTGTGTRVAGTGLTYELLRETVDGDGAGFRFHKHVTAGPYVMVAPVDMDALNVVLRINPYFHGTYDGTLPHIENIVLRSFDDNALEIPAMIAGEADMMIGTSGTVLISAFETLPLADGTFDYFSMPRNGSGGLFFHWDIGPTQFVEVRRAIAWTLDRHEFNSLWAQGHATTNDTLIAVASWMYIENRDVIPGMIRYNYTLNIANAVAELEAGGWTLRADGQPWTGPEDGPRHKDVDGELMPLIIRWASPAANIIGELLAGLMTEPANSIGMFFDQHFVVGLDFSFALTGNDPDWNPILGATAGTDHPNFDPDAANHPNRFNMINGGMGIPAIDAVWNTYSPDPDQWGNANWTRTNDELLYYYANGRRSASNREEYLRAWFGFISRFNEVLPALPLNADTFHDFFRANLQNYYRNDLTSWSIALVWANLEEYPR
jgi:peptide/nickel transport system substrate-binding protein